MKKVFEIRKELNYYLDAIVLVEGEGKYRIHFHTYENERLINLFIETVDEELIIALNYLDKERNPIFILDISAIIKNHETAFIY